MTFENFRLLLQFTIGLIVGVCLSGTAMAGDMPTKAKAKAKPKAIVTPAPVLNPWTFSATPYGWVTLLKGSTTVKGHTTDVSVGYSELWDLVKQSEIPKDLMAFMGYFEARNGRLGLFADVVYLKVG